MKILSRLNSYSRLPFSADTERNIFIFSILSQKTGPFKTLIHTSELMTSADFNKICQKHIKTYQANNPATDLISYICENTGWESDEYYNKSDCSYDCIDFPAALTKSSTT